MKSPFGDHRRRRQARSQDALDAVLRAMREEQEGGVSPDLADSVLARLGYAKASPSATRFEWLSRWSWRLAASAAVLAVVGTVLWSVHNARSEATRPNSVEEVVRASLAQKSRWLGDVANGIQPRGPGFGSSSSDAGTTPSTPTAPELPLRVPHPSSDGTAPAEAPLKKV